MSSWHRRDVPFKFQFSDWTIFRVCVPLFVRAVELSERLPPSDSPRPPTDHDLGDVEGYFVHALPVSAPLPTITVEEGYIRYVPLQYFHCYIDIGIGIEGYRSRFSAKTRSTISRKIRKFKEHCGGELSWFTYSTPEAMMEFHRLARSVSSLTYQERLLDAGIPEDTAFINDMMRLASAGQVRAFILFVGKKPVSYLYCPAKDGSLLYAYLGYDPAYKNFSVGTVLQWLVVEQLFQEQNFSFFDFTEGQSDHKRMFATHQLRCANVVFLRRTFRNSLLVRSHRLTDRVSLELGGLFQRIGLKKWIKRQLRFG